MIKKLFQDQKSFYRLLAVTILFSFVTALITYEIEKSAGNLGLDEWHEFIYWWVASLTTIGNGGYPEQPWGQFWGMITMIVGSFVYLGIFSEIILFLKHLSDEKYHGEKNYNGTGHVVVVGYNNLAISLINFLDLVLKPNVDIVLVTMDIDANPNIDRVHFLKYNPLAAGALDKANISKAKAAFVLAQDDVSAEKRDLNTLLVGGTIEEIQRSVFTFVEVSGAKKDENIKDFEIDAEFTFGELLQETRNSPRQSKILQQLPTEIKEVILKPDYIQKGTLKKISEAITSK